MRPSTVYVAAPADYDQHVETLKHRPCPMCRVSGNLIRHGFLRGYGENAVVRVQRGWRVFCSDRNRRTGCGRTYSILNACQLRRHVVRAERLWGLLKGILSGASVKAAWEHVDSSFCLDTGYRLWQAVQAAQSFLRARLLGAGPIPKLATRQPALQVLEHLQAVFPESANPVSSFQARFQLAFLDPRLDRSG